MCLIAAVYYSLRTPCVLLAQGVSARLALSPQELLQSLLEIIVRCAADPDAPVVDGAAVAAAPAQPLSEEALSFVSQATARWQGKMRDTVQRYRSVATQEGGKASL